MIPFSSPRQGRGPRKHISRAARCALRSTVLLALSSLVPGAIGAETPRPLPRVEDLGRAPLNQYGSLEHTIQAMRAHQPLDLNAARWRNSHPDGSYEEWRKTFAVNLDSTANAPLGKARSGPSAQLDASVM